MWGLGLAQKYALAESLHCLRGPRSPIRNYFRAQSRSMSTLLAGVSWFGGRLPEGFRPVGRKEVRLCDSRA